jgi:hypothetical protein
MGLLIENAIHVDYHATNLAMPAATGRMGLTATMRANFSTFFEAFLRGQFEIGSLAASSSPTRSA